MKAVSTLTPAQRIDLADFALWSATIDVGIFVGIVAVGVAGREGLLTIPGVCLSLAIVGYLSCLSVWRFPSSRLFRYFQIPPLGRMVYGLLFVWAFLKYGLHWPLLISWVR
jgi:hypothetical protein